MIEINELTKHYNERPALDKLSLTVSSGSIFGLIGPNGAGKSTTLNILTGITKFNSGTVSILGFDLVKNSREVKRSIGIVPEVLALFNGLTGEEHLTFVGNIYNVERTKIKRRVKDLLNYFDLTVVKEQLIETYSKGMKKKLAFASAIIHSPKILFLDEPFENVEPFTRKKMKEILIRMKDKGATIIIASHVLQEIEDLCGEVAIINKGKLVLQSETSKIRTIVKEKVSNETYKSLEEIFLDLVSAQNEYNKSAKLSWI